MRRMGATNNIENLTDDFLRQYASQQEGVPVNFRKEFPFLNGTERYSHAIHPNVNYCEGIGNSFEGGIKF